jgi:hydroxymethylpyrimidine/phosphomethylpyrimidine kinase
VPETPLIATAMTIAGSDSGAGAGIQADLKTFAALGVYGTSVVTAVTAQNTTSVLAIAEVPEEVIVHQIDGVIDDIGANAIKTGMLSSTSIIDVVSDRIDAWGITNLVVDPVMVAKSGDALLHPTAVRALVKQLLPLALVVTPNIPEAEVIAKTRIETDEDAERAARIIGGLGPKYVVIKGGHRSGDEATDLVFDGSNVERLSAQWTETRNTHGTGCTFSAAIAAFLARGQAAPDAIRNAKSYLTNALVHSYAIGAGHSPVNHFHAFPELYRSALTSTPGGTNGSRG